MFLKKFLYSILTLVLLFAPISNVKATEDRSFELTDEELEWLENHKGEVLNIGVEDKPSDLFFIKDGKMNGYIYEFFEMFSKDTGLTFKFVVDDWDSIINKGVTDEIQIVAGNTNTVSSSIEWLKSDPINSKSYWVCSKQNFQSVFDLSYKKIGMLSGASAYTRFESTYDIEVEPIFYEDYGPLFLELMTDKISGVMLQDSINLNKYLNFYNIERDFSIKDISNQIGVSTKVDYSVLINIIDQYITYNTNVIKQLVEDGYINYLRYEMNLVEADITKLKERETLKVGYIENFIPFDYIIGDNRKGISVEVLETIKKVLDVEFEYVSFTDVNKMEEALLKGDITLISSYRSYHGHGHEHTVATKPYAQSSIGAVGHRGEHLIPHKLHDLNGMRIALVEGGWQEHMLIANRIEYIPYYVKNIHDAMSMVNNNEVDYTIENKWVIDYLINELHFDNLKASGEIDIKDQRHFLFRREDLSLSIYFDEIISMINQDTYVAKGLHENYGIHSSYEFYEVLTVTLFFLLCFIGIYIAFLINRLNAERQKAEAANQSKSEFLAKMSHEIRTPLTAIMGYINLLSRSDNISGKEKQQLKIAYNSSNILIHLVNDILDFSKIEAGKVSLVKQSFNLRLMINNAINIIGVMAEEKQLDFIVKLHQELPKYIVGDERRLEQILINILSNSVKFTDIGEVELSISPEYFENKVRLNFVVRDTGKGMKTETINMIFDAFEQEDNSISRRYGGTGLGLYISKDFIERMDGEIKAESDIGKGTVFNFYTIHELAENLKKVEQKAAVLPLDALRGMRILLVEDNDINQMIIRDILLDMNFRVVIADNGKEALEIVSSKFDFVLMDIQMPVMNGIEAVNAMRRNSCLDQIPIIALTANVMPEQIDSYFKEGFDGYCSKPIMINELAQTLTQMYERFHTNDDEEESVV